MTKKTKKDLRIPDTLLPAYYTKEMMYADSDPERALFLNAQWDLELFYAIRYYLSKYMPAVYERVTADEILEVLYMVMYAHWKDLRSKWETEGRTKMFHLAWMRWRSEWAATGSREKMESRSKSIPSESIDDYIEKDCDDQLHD